MKVLRKTLGVLVMIAGVLGLVLSMTGLVGVWVVKPTVSAYANSMLDTAIVSVESSQKMMQVTVDALGSTVTSVEALSTMLQATATTVQDTGPVLDNLNNFMAEKLPATLEAASTSLKTAQKAADVLDGTIKSLDGFRSMLSGVPLLSGMLPPATEAYNPDPPLSESLGNLATTLDELPDQFVTMGGDLGKAGGNLTTVETSLSTMSQSVTGISTSLKEYKTMAAESQSSLENLKTSLTGTKDSLEGILNAAAIGLTLIFLWLLAAQVVILTQGWELYQGTANAMAGGAPAAALPVPAAVETKEPPAPQA